jgi:hypothetical protein
MQTKPREKGLGRNLNHRGYIIKAKLGHFTIFVKVFRFFTKQKFRNAKKLPKFVIKFPSF